MKILIIDDQLQEKIHNALKKEGYTMVYILEPRLVESYIMDFDPDLVLIRSDSNAYQSLCLIMDIKYVFPRLPIVFYSTENHECLNELKATIKNIMHDLSMSELPLKVENQTTLAS